MTRIPRQLGFPAEVSCRWARAGGRAQVGARRWGGPVGTRRWGGWLLAQDRFSPHFCCSCTAEVAQRCGAQRIDTLQEQLVVELACDTVVADL